MRKIVLFHNIITPVRTPFFNELARRLAEKGMCLKILFNAPTESNRRWDVSKEIEKFRFDYAILEGRQVVSKTAADLSYFHLNSGVANILDAENPDAVMHDGWASLSAFVACRWCKKNGKRFTLWSESTVAEKSWRRVVTRPLVRWLVRNSNDFWSFGSRAYEYLVSLGADPKRIAEAYNPIDTLRFLSKADELAGRKREIRAGFGIPEGLAVVSIAQLIRRKGLFELVEGVARYRQERGPATLVVVGSGPEESALKSLAASLGVSDSVRFAGHVEYGEIAKYLAAADVFALPSHEEVWGLVVNEALCFGLSVLTSRAVGAAADLVRQGENGDVIAEVTPQGVSEGLDRIVKAGLTRANSSRSIIADFSIGAILDGVFADWPSADGGLFAKRYGTRREASAAFSRHVEIFGACRNEAAFRIPKPVNLDGFKIRMERIPGTPEGRDASDYLGKIDVLRKVGVALARFHALVNGGGIPAKNARLHGDFCPGNVLFDQAGMIWLIDFEKPNWEGLPEMSSGSPYVDVAKFIHCLRTLYPIWRIDLLFGRRGREIGAFLEGYESAAGPVDGEELAREVEAERRRETAFVLRTEIAKRMKIFRLPRLLYLLLAPAWNRK